jgi:hypothetical protein
VVVGAGVEGDVVAVGVAVRVAVAGTPVPSGVLVGVRVGAGQPFKALFTAVRISSTVMTPSPLASPGRHATMSVFPSAIFTIVRISSTVT